MIGTAAAVVGLLFVGYCEVQLYRSWLARSRANLAAWFFMLLMLGSGCVYALLK